MIKVILHGGLGQEEVNQIALTEEIKKNLSRNSKILIIPFARQKEDWEKVYKKYVERYGGLGNEVEFLCATEDYTNLIRQMEMSDAIFFTGGNETLLKERLTDIAFEVFEGKTIFGSSAGANIFAEKYYSNDRDEIEDGFYKLPFYTMCHFDPQKKVYARRLHELDEKKKVISLKEGDFVVLFFNKYGEEIASRE
jgi:peptidase E